MSQRKERLATPAPSPTRLRSEESERFVLWAKDGQRIGEIEIPAFRPRVEIVLWNHRGFIWHDKTRRYVEGTCFFVPIEASKPKSKNQLDLSY
jgi:hypothetical protein